MKPIPKVLVLAPTLRERARDSALQLGERLLVQATHGNPGHEDFIPTRGFGGSSGYALAFMALARFTGDARFETATHQFIREAALVNDLPSIGLFNGISGLRAVAGLLTKHEPRYARLVLQCDMFIERHVPKEVSQPETFSAFDVISGWSGARLARCVDGPRQADRLVELLVWMMADEHRWRCVHPVNGGEPENDLGLAHGVTGALASLALTVKDLETVRELVVRCARTLAQDAVESNGVLCWPHSAQAPKERSRSAWCYGTPGVAATLHTIARRLHDWELETFATHALDAIAAQSTAEWKIHEPNLCHGMIGNALVFGSVASASGKPRWQLRIENLLNEALDNIDANDGKVMACHDGRLQDSFNVLTGSAGIILGLLTLTYDCDASWMRCCALQPIA